MTRIMDNKYVKRPAGVVLSPDETKIYLVEAHPSSPRLVVFELKRDGTVVDAPPYIVHDFDKGKGGDGLCIDSHGKSPPRALTSAVAHAGAGEVVCACR